MSPIEEKLIQSGLSHKPAAVYHAALQLGPTTVLRLARKTNLKRATVYSVVDDLINQGLMRIDEVGMKRVFVAEDPACLQRVMDKKMSSVAEVIPELQKLHTKFGRTKTIKTYEGAAALENIIERLMSDARSGDYRYLIGGDLGWQNVDDKLQKKYFKWRERISLDVKLLFRSSKRAEQHQLLAGALRQEVKVFPKEFPLEADLIITPRILVIIKLSNPCSAIVIEDVAIIATYRELFLYLWSVVPKTR